MGRITPEEQDRRHRVAGVVWTVGAVVALVGSLVSGRSLVSGVGYGFPPSEATAEHVDSPGAVRRPVGFATVAP